MKTVGKHLPLIGKRLGTKLMGCGKMLGSQLQSHHNRKRHFTQDGDGNTLSSDLERGSGRRHIHKDGHHFQVHGGPDRKPWQRKKNH